MSVSQLLPGRRGPSGCLKPTRARKKLKRCTREIARGTVTMAGLAGANSVAFGGRIHGKALPAGHYRAWLVARDADGIQSNVEMASFAVVKP